MAENRIKLHFLFYVKSKVKWLNDFECQYKKYPVSCRFSLSAVKLRISLSFITFFADFLDVPPTAL